MTFANPFGFLVLAVGGLAVVAIHFLRVKARRVPASTLFLLEATSVSSEGGRRVDRLRSSPLFWLQLLAVALLTWILVEPRWVRDDARQRVVLVVDVSASMSAFTSALAEALDRVLPEMENAAAETEWVVLASDRRERTLYTGTDRIAAREAIFSLPARLGAHDIAPVLGTAMALSGRFGRVVLLTDHDVETLAGVEVLAVGREVVNVGFAGADVTEDGSWRAIVKNSGSTRAVRHLGDESLSLGPGELVFIEGMMSPQQDLVELELERDEFTLDDRLVLLRPRAKRLTVHVAPALQDSRFVGHFLEILEPIDRVATPEAADLAIGPGASMTTATATATARARVVFAPSPSGTPRYRTGMVIAERHPFVDGLDFRGLLVREVGTLAVEDGDSVLLWQGNAPLMVLRRDRPELAVSLALEASNADRVPAFVLALHRFAESVRESKVASEQKNVETGQLVSVASDSPLTIDGVALPEPTSTFRAPLEPGTFEVSAGGRPLLRAAARFADVREADLSGADATELEIAVQREVLARNTLPDPLSQLWVLVLMGVLVASFSVRRS